MKCSLASCGSTLEGNPRPQNQDRQHVGKKEEDRENEQDQDEVDKENADDELGLDWGGWGCVWGWEGLGVRVWWYGRMGVWMCVQTKQTPADTKNPHIMIQHAKNTRYCI